MAAPSKRVYVHFDESFTTKIIVDPSSLASDILVKFSNAYAKHRKTNDGPDLHYFNILLEIQRNKQVQPKTRVFEMVEDGQDLYIKVDTEAHLREKTCTNSGCGQTYKDETNHAQACYHHPGMPIFHEGMKGWRCCTKRSVDFDEAMSIPGCTLGFHHSKPPVIKNQVINNKPIDPKYLPKSSVDGVESFSIPGAMSSKPQSSTNNDNQNVASQPPAIVEEPDDPLDAVIQIGTKCRHHGCNDTFKGDSSRTEPCVYHPGLAVFHEGSKYWTCCKPRCAEFEEFLKIEGCKVGRHKFMPKQGESNDPDMIKCRYDFYQQGDYIISSIYGKNMNKETSSIQFKENEIEVRIKFKDGKKFEKDIKLYGPIDPSKSSFEILTTKVEMKLLKATPIVWEKLEPEEI